MSGVLRSDPVDIAAGHLSAGRVSEARAIYEQVLRAEPTHARALCGLGAVALRGGEVGRAFDLIGRAAAIAPADGTVAGNLGVVHVARKDLSAAEDCFRRALDLAPDQPGLHANLAMVLLARGDHETALTAQRHAVALAPGSAGQRFNLAVILGVVGRSEAAAAAYEETLAIDPAHAGALANLAVLRKRAGRLDEAEALLDEARLREPMSPEILASHADLLLRRGRRDEGLAEMRRAVGLAPANASVRAALGAMLMEIGLLDEAGREVAAAARRAPDNADLAFVLARLLLRRGRLRPLPATVATSPRRYEEEGRVRALLRNLRLIAALHAGADPASLAAAYPPRRRDPSPAHAPDPASPPPILLVFAKAPRPGKVKTRLARALGDERAAALYRRMGRLVLDGVAAAPATVTACFAPDDAEAEVREWLGASAARYWPQGDGDLGARMSRMFDRAFQAADRALVVGTDAPAVDDATIRRALEALDSADVVLGPSRDGGYYLLGLRRPRPGLFEAIRWSTGSVMRETAERARGEGLEVTFLEVESDIDTAADLTPGVVETLGREV